MPKTVLTIAAVVFDLIASVILMATFFSGRLETGGAIVMAVALAILALNIAALALNGAFRRPPKAPDDTVSTFD